MSVSNISSTATATAGQSQPRSGQNAGLKDLRQLIQAIQSGDLATAQSAYDSLSEQIQQSNPAATTSSSATPNSTTGSDSNQTSFQQFLQQVGAALDSNNIQGAQQALNSFEQQTKGTHHHRHGGGGGAAGQAGTSKASTSTTSINVSVTTSTASSGVDVTV